MGQMEYLTFETIDNIVIFDQIWTPVLDYVGLRTCFGRHFLDQVTLVECSWETLLTIFYFLFVCLFFFFMHVYHHICDRDHAVLCVQFWMDCVGEGELSEGFVWRGGLKMKNLCTLCMM